MRNYVTNLDTIIIRHGKNPEEIHSSSGRNALISKTVS